MTRLFTAVLAVSAVLAATPAAAKSPGLYFRPRDWNKEILGAQRLPDVKLDESRTPGQITVITASDIRNSGARTLQEVLSNMSGVNQFDEIGNGFQGTLDLRGFNASPVPATAVIVDGVRVNEVNFSQVNYQLIPLENIEKIEIHPGPSTLYGKNALAGIIHITTKRGGPDKVTAETGASYGSFNRKKGWTSVGGAVNGFDYYISGTKESENGYRAYSNANIGTVKAKLGYKQGERTDITVSYTRVDDRLQQSGSLTGPEIAQDPKQAISNVDYISRMDFFNYNQRQAFGGGFSMALNVHLRKRREHSPLNRGRTSVSEFLVDMESKGVTAQLSQESEVFDRRNVTSFGAETTRNQADSRSSGSFGAFPFANANMTIDDSVGFFFQNILDVIPETLVLTTGLRYDESKVKFDNKLKPAKSGEQFFNRTSPRIGLNYNHSDSFRTYAIYSEAFRTPTISEISSLGPFGNSILKPVKAKNYEIGAQTQLGKVVELRMSLFRTDLIDEIFPVFDPTAGFGKNINVDKTRRTGIEWGLKAGNGILDGYLNHAYTKSTFQTDLTLDKAPWPATQEVKKGDLMPMVPEHRVAVGINIRPKKGWTVSLDETCVGPQRIIGDESNTEPRLPGYCLTNLGTSYERADWRVFFKGFNMLDKSYHTRGILATNPATFDKDRFLVQAPGINVQAGISYRFTAGAGTATASAKTPDITGLARRAIQ